MDSRLKCRNLNMKFTVELSLTITTAFKFFKLKYSSCDSKAISDIIMQIFETFLLSRTIFITNDSKFLLNKLHETAPKEMFSEILINCFQINFKFL